MVVVVLEVLVPVPVEAWALVVLPVAPTDPSAIPEVTPVEELDPTVVSEVLDAPGPPALAPPVPVAVTVLVTAVLLEAALPPAPLIVMSAQW